jgi:hypothetical protein
MYFCKKLHLSLLIVFVEEIDTDFIIFQDLDDVLREGIIAKQRGTNGEGLVVVIEERGDERGGCA